MAVSGTISQTSFDTAKVIERAFRRCKLPPQRISGELVTLARDTLYLVLSELGAYVNKLWTEERLVLGLQQGRASYELPDGTLGVTGAFLRSTAALSGTLGTRLNGITLTFDSTSTVPVVGFTPSVAGTYELVFEFSSDGTTWTVAGEAAAQYYEAGQTYWGDVDAAPQAIALCVRDDAGLSLAGASIVAGTNPREIVLTQVNKHTYRQIPNKTSQGRPVEYFIDRQRDTAILNLWQTADATTAANGQLVLYRKRHIMDVGDLTGTLDIPQIWFNAIVAMLAHQLCLDSVEVDQSMAPVLKQLADEKVAIALASETDNAPITFNYGIRRYTR